jgi:acetyl esterase/lipase
MSDIPNYDPSASYPVRFWEAPYRHTNEVAFPAYIYEPQAPGPFPILLDVHGGAWGAGDPLQNSDSQRSLASSGLIVAAIEFRTSAVAAHPAALEDISFAIRWLKAHAAEINGSAAGLGAVGWSSGGHQVMLSAMRPYTYATLPLDEAPDLDATLAYVVMGWPVIDPVARHQLALEGNLVSLTRDINDFVERHYTYFGDDAAMEEANPQRILERGESVYLPPALLIQGANDQQLPRGMAERFVDTYSLAGGTIELGKYPNAAHGFLRNGGPNATRGLAQVKSFIARQLNELRDAAD